MSSSFASSGDSKSSQAKKEEDSSGQVDSLNSTSVQTMVSTMEKVLLQTATVPIQSSDIIQNLAVMIISTLEGLNGFYRLTVNNE